MTTESFWKGDFGNDYLKRSPGSVESNVAMFSKILPYTEGVSSVMEFGAGVGNNLKAIHGLLPEASLGAVEINSLAARSIPSYVEVWPESVLTAKIEKKFDLVLTKGFLIHVPPQDLKTVYDIIYWTASKYILLCEYYNPTPVEIPYRGYRNVLWKRDFAGEMMEKYPLRLIQYGFVYRRDQYPQDDLHWFLLSR